MQKTASTASSILGIALLIIAAAGAYKFNVSASDTSNSHDASNMSDTLSSIQGFMMTTSDGLIMARGTLEKPQVSGWMYGSHKLGGFALKSKNELDRYVGQAIIVLGKPVAGYPVENGPYLLDIKHVEVDQMMTIQQ